MHADKIGQVTNFRPTVGGTAKHSVDQYMVLFYYCSLGVNTAMQGGLHARLCHGYLVLCYSTFVFWVTSACLSLVLY